MQLLIRRITELFLALVTLTFLTMFYDKTNFVYNKIVLHLNYGNVFNQNLRSILSTKELSLLVLKIQEKQMHQSIHASFLPETHDQFVTVKLRLDELIKKYAQSRYYGKSPFHDFVLILRYYEFTNQTTMGNEVFNVTFSLKSEVDISSDAVTSSGQVKSLFIINVTLFNQIAQPILGYIVPSPSTDVINEQITVPARFLMYNSYTYRFSLEIIQPKVKNTIQVILNWPDWPLSVACLNEIMTDLSNKNNNQYLFNVTPLNYPCTVTDRLFASSMYSSFVKERTAVAHWLDAINEASDISSSSSVLYGAQKRNEKPINLLPTHRRLHPFEKSLNTTICSRAFRIWIKDYQEWHLDTSRIFMQMQFNSNMIKDYISSNNIRFLFYQKTSGDHGASDRIVHLISTYLIAILTRRFFVFDPLWPELERVYRISLNVLPNIVIPWLPEILRLDQVENLTSSDTSHISAKTYTFATERYARDYNYDVEFPERIVTMDGYTGNVVHTISSVNSMYSNFLRTTLKMTEENLFGCLYHSLMIPRLKSLIQMTSENDTDKTQDYRTDYTYGKILQILISPNFHSIGLQIRVGDSSFSNASQVYDDPSLDNQLIQKYEHFFSCAYELTNIYKKKSFGSSSIDDSPSVVVFLASDNMQLRRAALRRWQLPHTCLNKSGQHCSILGQWLRLIATTNVLEHSAHSDHKLRALEDVMMDTFLFSLCQEHIFTMNSGFGRVPAFAALNFRNVYSFLDRDRSSCSHPNKGIKLETSAHHQAGIR